ncbi:MAG: hypothetical protein K2N18_05835 [Clostridia bacterium]|nr:hypothetical protein [Clostridia bacterium]
MQRQKTIAKWLAIILLLTSIIACYIAFSSIIKNKTASAPDIAGADADGSGGGTGTPPKPETPEPPAPTYSTFPRSPEALDGMSINHVGGEDNDILLDTLYYSGKRFVIFYSASTQYDVKECGIHIATFKDGELLSTTKIGEVEEVFITSSIVENGLLIITKTAVQTKLRLLNANLGVICENACPLYSDYKLYVTSASARLYTLDDRYIYANTISKSLEVKRSSFVYPIDNGEILYTAGLNSYDTIFVQTAVGVGFLTYTASDGFNLISELPNCKLMQVMPGTRDGNLVFTLLAKRNDGILIANVDGNLKQTASYTVKNAKTAVAMQSDNGNICVIADGTKTVLCSHLDFQSSSNIDIPVEAENPTFRAIDGENGTFIISQDDTHYIVSYENDALTLKHKIVGKSVIVVRDLIEGKSTLSLLYNSNDESISFGAYDVLYTHFV